MILDRLMMAIILVIIYTVSIYEIEKKFESAQPVKVEINFSENIPPGTYGYALVLTNRTLSISSDGKRMFDLTSVYLFHNTNIFFHC